MLATPLHNFLLAAAIVMPLTASAQREGSSPGLARELVQILRYEQQMEAYRKTCINTAKSVSPESLVKENPEKYGGVDPSSRHWPKVVQAYEQYYKELCDRPTVSELLDALAQVYAGKMSAADLKAAIAFYSTDAGKRLIEGHKLAAGAVNEVVSKAYSSQVPKAMGNFDRRVDEIALEAEADRKKCPPTKSMRSNSASEDGRAACGPRAAQRGR